MKNIVSIRISMCISLPLASHGRNENTVRKWKYSHTIEPNDVNIHSGL